VVPGSELVVSRTAYKNNSSKYQIGPKDATFKQVQDLLKNKGIDLEHKRFLILQGEVESIALMKPKGSGEGDEGLLEYLEDIIGTTKSVSSILSDSLPLNSYIDIKNHLLSLSPTSTPFPMQSRTKRLE
jgi:structural maintenance of chromosome 4